MDLTYIPASSSETCQCLLSHCLFSLMGIPSSSSGNPGSLQYLQLNWSTPFLREYLLPGSPLLTQPSQSRSNHQAPLSLQHSYSNPQASKMPCLVCHSQWEGVFYEIKERCYGYLLLNPTYTRTWEIGHYLWRTERRKWGREGWKEEAICVQLSHQNIRETFSKALQKETFYPNKAPLNWMPSSFQYRASFIYKTGIGPNNNKKDLLAHAVCQTLCANLPRTNFFYLPSALKGCYLCWRVTPKLGDIQHPIQTHTVTKKQSLH